MASLTGGMVYPHDTSVSVACSSLIPAKIALGTRARDVLGNEYMYVDFDAAKAKGEVVAISSAFLASDVGATTVGVPLGVVMGTVSSSDMAGWVQIYGVNEFVLQSTASSSGNPLKAIAVSGGYSVLGGLNSTGGSNFFVDGIYRNTSETTASSLTGTTLFGYGTVTLNYPFITGKWASTTGSTSGA